MNDTPTSDAPRAWRQTQFGRRIAALALAIAVTGIAIEGATATFASDNSTIDDRLAPVGLAGATRAGPPVVVVPPTPRTVPEMINDVVVLTNAERVAGGLQPLIFNHQLAVAAADHANDQRNQPCAVGYLSHTGSDGSSGGDRILRTGLNISRWGENVACAYRSGASVVRGWMYSPSHRANLMDPGFTHIGVSVATSDTGQLYWVQEFAILRG